MTRSRVRVKDDRNCVGRRRHLASLQRYFIRKMPALTSLRNAKNMDLILYVTQVYHLWMKREKEKAEKSARKKDERDRIIVSRWKSLAGVVCWARVPHMSSISLRKYADRFRREWDVSAMRRWNRIRQQLTARTQVADAPGDGGGGGVDFYFLLRAQTLL